MSGGTTITTPKEAVPGYDKSVNGLTISNTIRKAAEHETENETEAKMKTETKGTFLFPVFLTGILAITVIVFMRHRKQIR